MTEFSNSICQQGKILVVTGHRLTPDSMKSLLENHLYCVQTTPGGEPALQAAKEFLPDMILLDTVLPYTTGLELCQRLKAEESTRHIPVLFVVTPGQPEDKDEIFRVGGIDYIATPFDNQELLARLAIHIAMQRLKAELETERRENVRLSQENKQWEQTFAEQVKQRTHELEEALINERSECSQIVDAARLTTMSKMAALFAQELGNPLNTIRQDLLHMKRLVQEDSLLAKPLEHTLLDVEYLVKTIANLNHLCKL